MKYYYMFIRPIPVMDRGFSFVYNVSFTAVKKGLITVVADVTQACKRIVFPFIGGGLANGIVEFY